MRVDQQLHAERDVVEHLTSQANTYAQQLALVHGRRPITGKLALKLEMTERALARHKRVVAGLEAALAMARDGWPGAARGGARARVEEEVA